MTILNFLILVLWAPATVLILWGIWNEEKLIHFERRIFKKWRTKQ